MSLESSLLRKGMHYELSHLKAQYHHYKRQAEKTLYKIELIEEELSKNNQHRRIPRILK